MVSSPALFLPPPSLAPGSKQTPLLTTPAAPRETSFPAGLKRVARARTILAAPPPQVTKTQATEGTSLRKVRTEKLPMSGQALSRDTLRFNNRGMKGKSVPRPARSPSLAHVGCGFSSLPASLPPLGKHAPSGEIPVLGAPLAAGNPQRDASPRHRPTETRPGQPRHRPTETGHRANRDTGQPRELLYEKYVRKNFRYRRRRVRGTDFDLSIKGGGEVCPPPSTYKKAIDARAGAFCPPPSNSQIVVSSPGARTIGRVPGDTFASSATNRSAFGSRIGNVP